MFDILVIGGGLYGTLSALECSIAHPQKRIALFEKRAHVLSDLRPEHRISFQGKKRTPTQLLKVLQQSSIRVYRSSKVILARTKDSSKGYEIQTRRSVYHTQHLILACGKDADSLKVASDLGLETRPLQAAAFALQSEDPRIRSIKVEGLHVALSWVKSGSPRKRIQIHLASTLPQTQALMETEGLITIHSGNVSGEAIRKLTSHIAQRSQIIPEHLRICINWIPDYEYQGVLDYLQIVASAEAGKTVLRTRLFELPAVLWSSLVAAADIGKNDLWQDLLPSQLQKFATQLTDSQLTTKPDVRPASITAVQGGVNPNDLRTDRPESKELAGLYLVGSIIDMDTMEVEYSERERPSEDFSWIQGIGKKA